MAEYVAGPLATLAALPIFWAMVVVAVLCIVGSLLGRWE